jgi:hypothetical protein
MADFGFVRQQAVSDGATASFTLYGIEMPNGANPVLVGRYAGEANRPYYNALLKRQAKRVQRTQAALRAGMVDPEMLAQNRDDDRELFPRFVLTGWAEVCDAKGKEVPFNEQNAADFLAALPNEDFDDARNFFSNRSNFRKAESMTTEEAVAEGNA